MRLQCSPPTRYVKNGGNTCGVRYLENVSKLEHRLFACFVHPRCITWFSGHFFSAYSVHASSKRKKE